MNKKHLDVVTNSSIQCFRRCNREYYYRYVKLRRPKRVGHPLRFGTLMHRALNAWWSDYGSISDALHAISDNYMKLDLSEIDRIKAEELIREYSAVWSSAKFSSILVEKRFSYPISDFLADQFDVAGSIDALALKDGKLVIVEHKTTSKDIDPASDYWTHVFSMDTQVSVYVEAISRRYKSVECLYDVIKKVDMVPREATPVDKRKYTKKGNLYAGQRDKDETMDEFRTRVRQEIGTNASKYFARRTVPRTGEQLELNNLEFKFTAQAIASCSDPPIKDRFVRNAGACDRFGSRCDYYGVCSGTESLDSTSFRTALVPHEELE